jgi:hypothetical protein
LQVVLYIQDLILQSFNTLKLNLLFKILMFSPKDVWFAFDYALDINFAPIPYLVCVWNFGEHRTWLVKIQSTIQYSPSRWYSRTISSGLNIFMSIRMLSIIWHRSQNLSWKRTQFQIDIPMTIYVAYSSYKHMCKFI